MGELFSDKGLRVPSLTEEEKIQRIASYGGILKEIGVNLDIGRPYTLVDELEAERARLAADRTILSKQLSSVALADEVGLVSSGDHRLF